MLVKRKFIIFVSSFTFFVMLGFFLQENMMLRNSTNEKNDMSEVLKQERTLSMMVEQTAGAGDYEVVTRSSWPTSSEGYIFNSALSKCENGGELGWDDEKGVVTMTGNMSDKCYVYFDSLNLLSFIFSPSSNLFYGSLYLNDVSISDKIGNTIEFKVGDILKYTNTAANGHEFIYIYDANDNLIETLSGTSTDYTMTGKEVSIVSKRYDGGSK